MVGLTRENSETAAMSKYIRVLYYVVTFTFVCLAAYFASPKKQSIELASTKQPVAAKLWSNIPPAELHPALRSTVELMRQERWVNQFGDSVASDKKELGEEWKSYRDRAVAKVQKNAPRLASELYITDDLAQHIYHLFAMSPVITGLKQLMADKAFLALTKQDAFRRALTHRKFLEEVSGPEFLAELQKSPSMKSFATGKIAEVIAKLTKILPKEHTLEAIEYTRITGLSVMTDEERLGAEQLLAHYRSFFVEYMKSKGTPVDKSKVQDRNVARLFYENLQEHSAGKSKSGKSLKIRRIRLAELSYPPAAIKGSWADYARDLTQEAVQDFLLNHKTGDATLDNVSPPTQTQNFFDSVFLPLHEASEAELDGKTFSYRKADGSVVNVNVFQRASIDFIARTLWGEVRGCTDENQLEIVARTIGDRGEAIEASFKDIDSAERQNAATLDLVSEQVLKKNPNFGKLVAARMSGFAGLGRTDLKNNMTVDQLKERMEKFGEWGGALQAASRYAQYSIWNYKKVEPEPLYNLVKLDPGVQKNIPNFPILLARSNDTSGDAFISVLEPEIPKNKGKSIGQYPDTWLHAVELATLLVMDLEKFKDVFQWPEPYKKVMNYCHQGVIQPGLEVWPIDKFIIRANQAHPLVAPPNTEHKMCHIQFFGVKGSSAF